jgi:anthranilate synthase component 2
MNRLVLIDNFDSFTWNLVHLVGGLGADIRVVRNDAVSVEELRAERPRAILISPGPCTPNEAGVCLEVITRLSDEIPIFGVCLGMQAIGQAMGGEVVRAPVPVHGKTSQVTHSGGGLFHGLNRPIGVARYHSLVIRRETCPQDLSIEAQSEDGLIMAVSHRTRPLHGVQFHPESIASEGGATIVQNFLDLADEWTKNRSA